MAAFNGPVETVTVNGNLQINDDGTGNYGNLIARSIVTVPGITTDGVTDNYAAITSAANAFTGGGTVVLPAGLIAVSQPIVLPAGVILRGAGGAAGFGAGAGSGTILTGTPGSTLAQIVHLSHGHSGLRDLAVNAYSTTGAFGNALLIDADSVSLGNVSFQGGSGVTAVQSTGSATNCDISVMFARDYSGAEYALESHGTDWTVNGLRTLGQTLCGSAGSIWVGSHFVAASGSTVNVTVTADSEFTGCYFDSVNSAGATALIQQSGGSITLTGCRYFQNYALSGFPILAKTGGVVNLTGGIVISPSQGASGTFSCLCTGASTWDSFTDLVLETNAVPASGGVATLFLATSGGPAVVQNVSFDGVVQQRASTGVNGFALQNGTPTIVSWTTPNNLSLHSVIIVANINVTSAQTGGQVTATYTMPDGTAASSVFFAGGFGVSQHTAIGGLSVKSGTAVTLAQSSAQTAGAATVWADITGS
jgi:hypothetical protein